MNELYRVTGVSSNGVRKTLTNRGGPAIYTNRSSANRALGQFTARFSYYRTWYTDMRIERADTSWDLV